MSHIETGDPKPSAPITNIFVLMLENHSFDNIFAKSGIKGIKVATDEDSNSWVPPGASQRQTVHVHDGAPASMPTDPGHEFVDVLEQLCGVKPCCPPNYKGDPALCNNQADCYPGGKYPDINLSGFASNYARSQSEGTGRPKTSQVGDIMACFDTQKMLPVIYQLANEYAICDTWHSSMPGPTWPNRFFVHGASSAGVAQSPDTSDEIVWETVKGFEYSNGSIFQALTKAGHKWRLYQDKDNDFSDQPSSPLQGGWISQVASLKGVSLLDVHSFRKFRSDLNRKRHDGTPEYLDTPYTFIEPNFGASFFDRQDGFPGPSYKGGSSQHPEDDPSGGEGLIKAVYESIRNSPVWETSLLMIIYDEHGGFYDSVKPCEAVKPGDSVPDGHDKLNEWKFDFSQYGVRVPAVIVSPYIPRNTVDHTLYDHSSVLATLERMLDMPPLTKRDATANCLQHLLSLQTPRSDCPECLCEPVTLASDRESMGDAQTPAAGQADTPLPGPSNMAGFLNILLKTELELSPGNEEENIIAKFQQIKTMRQAQEYLQNIKSKLDAISDRNN